MGHIYRYYVEGECEQHFLDTFKSGKNPKFKAGKVEVFNVLTEKITKMRLINFSKSTSLVLVYDTDKSPTDIFEKNLELLQNNPNICEIIHVQSVNNFEEELVYSCNIKNINELFGTESAKEFKTKFISSNIETKLKKFGFDFKKIWSRKASREVFLKHKQNGKQIKLEKYK